MCHHTLSTGLRLNVTWENRREIERGVRGLARLRYVRHTNHSQKYLLVVAPSLPSRKMHFFFFGRSYVIKHFSLVRHQISFVVSYPSFSPLIPLLSYHFVCEFITVCFVPVWIPIRISMEIKSQLLHEFSPVSACSNVIPSHLFLY